LVKAVVVVSLAEVRSLNLARRPRSAEELDDLEQELIDQYLLATVSVGLSDRTVAIDRSVIFEFLRFLDRPIWTTQPADVDRFLAYQRKQLHRARLTVQHKAWALAKLFDFLITRYQGDIHAVTGYVLVQPVDEFNRPKGREYGRIRVPPSSAEVEALFGEWREWLPQARKYRPAARDYFAASLWRRVGMRIQETYMLDIRDWRPDLGEFGKIHVRYGKGSFGRGPKARLVPAINQVDELLDWWMSDVRHQFGEDYLDADAPLLPSEHHDALTGWGRRVCDQSLRNGLEAAVRRWLPAWDGRLTPHTLRHYCASSLYEQGMDLRAIQELLGHDWLATTTLYVHVHATRIETAWADANARTAARLAEPRE
jgi:site-specific recombinase XerD